MTEESRKDYWFSRRNLERQKATKEGLFHRYGEVRERYDSDPSSVAALHSDNLLRGEARARIYRALLRRPPRSILDVGCGIGLTTAGLKRVFPSSECLGIEASADAVAVAQRLSGGSCAFRAMFVEGDTRLDRQFDLVLFQEFYPLTRTADWDVHLPVLRFAVAHLSEHGEILIQLAVRHPETTILNNFDRVAAFCAAEGLTLDRRSIPFDRLVSWFHFPAAAHLFTPAAAAAFRADRRCVLQIGRG